MNERRESIPGSGLPTLAYLFVLLSSIGLFLGWNGLLWNAPREASHVGRFAVSYLAVIPIAAVLLLLVRNFRWVHLITTTGSVWAIKLIVTAVLYEAVARGTASHLQAVAPGKPQKVQYRETEYHPAAGPFAAGTLTGRVLRAAQPIAGALVFLDAPAPGSAPPAPGSVTMELSGSAYAQPLYLAQSVDVVKLWNHDAVLHTAHFHGAFGLPKNQPVPPSATAQPFDLPEPGLYHLRCDNHPNEATWFLILDHPYVTRSAADGSFSLPSVPVGPVQVMAVVVDGEGAYRAEARSAIHAGATAEVTLDLSDLRESAR